jgi:hypothetical protein
LARLGHLDHHDLAVTELAAAPDASVRALHTLDGQGHTPSHNDALAHVEPSDFLGDAVPIDDI